MAINEEKILVLKMLEEGKITSEEAARLLEALEGNSKQSAGDATRQQKQSSFYDEVARMKERGKSWKEDFKQNHNQKDFDKAVDDFSTKVEKLGRNVAATTFGVVDKVVDFVGSFVDTHAFNMFGSYKLVEKTFEAPVEQDMELSIEGINGHIQVKKHLENKILIKSRVRSPLENVDSILVFSNSTNHASLQINKSSSLSVSHEIFLPAVKFKSMKLETSNGRIHVEDSLSDTFEANTKNSHIELMGVNSDKITLNTKNARIQISYVIGKEIGINTKNSLIDIKHIKAEKVSAVTMNGRILVENAQNYEGCAELSMDLRTSNGGIKVNMNDMDQRGYKVRAKSSNAGINLLIPEMVYHNINRQGSLGGFVEAESSGYNSNSRRVYMNLETANGYIEVVK